MLTHRQNQRYIEEPIEAEEQRAQTKRQNLDSLMMLDRREGH